MGHVTWITSHESHDMGHMTQIAVIGKIIKFLLINNFSCIIAEEIHTKL